MEQADWLNMLAYQQELHRFSRLLLSPGQQRTLSAGERELLARLYLEPENSTPLALSRSSGMKKEAVSRCLKRLFEKGCIRKEKHPQDERSYLLSLTPAGEEALREDYGSLLHPLYQLRRLLGPEFDTLFQLVTRANDLME